MPFKPNENLLNYDVFPKVFVCGKKTAFHIRPLGGRPQFTPGGEYRLVICGLDGSNPATFPATGDYQPFSVTANSEGGFDFEHVFSKEQEYFLRFEDLQGKRINQFPVYCVSADLAGRYPFLGDLHIHTNRSDGQQDPNVVCANYRRHGYDFMAITDHNRYYPSLDAIAFYKDIPTELNIVPGEEVHLPQIDGLCSDVHMVNFGGEYSINALIEGLATRERGTDPSSRSLNGQCPPVMSFDAYAAMMRKRMEETQVPEGIDPYAAAGCQWVFEEIRKANGLGIFAHPTWIANTFHVPEAFTEYLMETQPFDAFEVLGGENYFEQNGFQTLQYYEDRAKGRKYPIVGSTDSHSSHTSNRNALICSTIVFSPENERTALIDSIKNFYSVAVDTISEEFRLVGERRLAKYVCFLLKEYFPLHDELCAEEGRLMKQAACGTAEEREEALKVLGVIYGRVRKLREKYFSF